MLASPFAGFLLGWLTMRIAVALILVTGMVVFTGAMVANDDWYSRVPEDVQATVTFSLALGALGAFAGVVLRRRRATSA